VAELPAVLNRHYHVEKDKVGQQTGLQTAPCLAAILSYDDLVALVLQNYRQTFTGDGVILNDQYSLHLSRFGSYHDLNV